MKNRLLDGEALEFGDLNENHLLIWFNDRTGNFCLMLNAKCIKATKTWNPIETKLATFGELEEL